jgi:hypothetical protein
MQFLSSNSFSVHQQIADAVDFLRLELPETFAEFTKEFPEFDSLVWPTFSSWVDTEASGVDVEYMFWVSEWLENHTPVVWWDGEPVLWEQSDTDEMEALDNEYATL